MTTTFYSINYPTAGTFDQSPKTAMNYLRISEGQEWRGDARCRFSAIKHNGRLFITNEIASILGCGRSWETDAHIGRAYLYDFEKHFDDLVERQKYPERNDRERFVTARNNKIIEMLFNLL